MAISPSTLFGEAVNSGDPWTIVATPTLTNGKLLTISVAVQCFGGGTLPTNLSFNRGTWNVVTHVDDVPSPSAIWMFRGIGDGSSGAFTISQTGGANLKMSNCTCKDWTGVDTGGTNGSNAITQFVGIGPSASANPQVISGSLGSAPAGDSAVYFVVAGGAAQTQDAAFAEIIDQAGADTFIEDQWVTPGLQNVSATGASAFQPQVGIAIELKATGGAVSGPTPGVLSKRMIGWTRRVW